MTLPYSGWVYLKVFKIKKSGFKSAKAFCHSDDKGNLNKLFKILHFIQNDIFETTLYFLLYNQLFSY